MRTLSPLLTKGRSISAQLRNKMFPSSHILLFLFLISVTAVNGMRKTHNSRTYKVPDTNILLSTATVGFGGNYTTLKAAFDAINAGSLTGAITLQIISSTTETATASLNSSGTGLANYNSVLIYPTGTGYSISGSIANPLVNLNGADNVVIDGRVNASGATAELDFRNSNTGITACALKLVNSAENNTVKYTTLAASGLSLATAVINFSTSASGNGNDTNVIEFCNVTNAGGNRPYNAILSTGSAGRENSGNSIRNTMLFNFMNNNSNSFGVNISIYSSDWNINNNSFYDTAALAPTGSYTYGAIRVATPNMHTVSGNYIGGSQPLCGGSPLTIISSFDTYYSGIFVTGSTTTPPLIQNNTIQNFNYSSTNANPWDGIYLSSGSASLIGNTIGSVTGTNSVVVTTPNAAATATITAGFLTGINLVSGGSGFTTAPLITFTLSGSLIQATATANIVGGVVTGFTITNGGLFYTSVPNVNINGAGYSTTHGIRCLNSSNVTIENNSIGSITTYGNAAYSHCFEAIVISGFPTSVIAVNNNTIGSLSTANSIKTSSPATNSIFKQDLRGIYVNSAVDQVTVSGNTIANTTNSYTGSATSKVDGICSNGNNNIIQNNTIRDISACTNSITVRGIQQFVTTSGTNQSVTGNTIYNLSNTHPTASLVVIGIDYTGPTTGTNIVSGNFVHGLSASSSNVLCEIDGIMLGNGVTTVANNIINLGTSVTTGYKMYGINDSSSSNAVNRNSIYFNSVYLSGTVSSTITSSTASLWNANATAIRNYRNNILMNVRIGGTTGKHYSIRTAGSAGLTIDYNDYCVTGGAFLGSFNNTDKTTLAAWKLATLQDANSLNTNPLFTTAGSTDPLNYYTSAILPAATGTGIATDFTSLARNVNPKMGALEITAYVWSGATSTNFATATNWQNGVVPPNGSDISFAVSPLRNCILDQNRTLRNITNAQATYKFLLNGNQLTLLGNLIFSNNAKMDATATSSVLVFEGTTAQIIPSGALVSNTANGCTLNNSNGLVLNNDTTIVQSLTLTSGSLSIGAHILTLNGAINSTAGTLTGGSASNIVIGGSGISNLPAVILNNLTVNRAIGISLAGSVSVLGTLVLTSGTIAIGANSLTISGNSPTRVNGAIDVSTIDAALVFSNSSAIILPTSFFATAVNNLTISGAGGITSQGDFTLNGILDLANNNPSAIKGLLDMWDGATAKAITLGANATNIGLGDTTGIITRSSFIPGVSYTLGSPFMKVYFNNIGTLPSQLSLKLSIGTTPSWRTGAINREIEVRQTGAAATSGVVSFHYLDNELNGNTEENMVLWVKIGNIEYGRSAFNTADNWVSLSNVDVGFFSSTFDGTKNVTLDEFSTINTLTWNGSVSTSWTTVQNWTPNVGPSASKNIVVPDTSSTTYAPVLPSITDVKSLTINTGGVVNSVAAAQLTLEGTNAWSNHGGTFNANTSTVIFNNAAATMSGTTNFYNVTINSGKSLSMTEECNIRIAGDMVNNGVWNTLASGSAFVEYNGAAQTIVNPNGATAGYSNLILSGSGTKTMDSALGNIYGNFSLADAVTTTAASALTIGGNVVIGQNATFNTGNFNHSIAGNFDDSGTFNASSNHNISLNGTSLQSILGTSVTTFGQLTINNNSGVTMNEPTYVTSLILANGVFKIDNTLGILGTITKTFGSLEVSPVSSLSFGGSGAMVLANDLFSGQTTLYNLTINRSGGLTLGQNMTVNGVLNLTAGNLNIGDNNLTIEATGTISVVTPNTSKMIIASGLGEVRKMMITGSSFTYPIGDNTGTLEYSPITITLADDGSANNYYGVKVINAKHPNNASTTDYLNRYWSLSRSGNTSHLANIAATYTSSDVVGTETSLAGASLTGDFDQLNNPWIKHNVLSGNTINLTNISIPITQVTVFTGISGTNPTVSLSGDGVACSGSNVALNTSVTAEAPVLYNWSPPDFLSSTTIANPIATNITATTNYTVTIRDANGISASANGTVSMGNTTTWTGTWDNGEPTTTSAAILAANYTATGSITCCSLTVNNNATVIIPSGFTVTIYGALTVSSGSFTLQNNANLIQTSNAANSGNIIVKRSSSALKRLDYTLWSSPVDGQQLQAFSPLTLTNRFYNYDSTTNLYSIVVPTVNFETAKGYLIRVPNNHPLSATIWNGTFTGVPHNGNYSFPMSVGDATHRFNLVGNPYPSPISMIDFVAANSSAITGTLYFWRKTNNAASPSYCSWTNGTFVNNGEAEVVNPNGIIRTGQGFFVEAKEFANTVSFTNAQRTSDTSNQFFRNTDDDELNRIWLNAANTSGSFSQIAVGYVSNATQGLDEYDGKYINDGAIELYSLVNAEKLVIQGRAVPFDASDVVPLGFKTSAAGIYSITLDHVDGLFLGSQDIFIKDNLTATIHDIKSGPYSFSSEIGLFESRFEIIYTNTLANPTTPQLENQVIAYKSNDKLIIKSGTIILESVKVFDVRGRLLTEEKSINATETELNEKWPNGVLIVRITSIDGTSVVKKVLW